MAITSTKQSIVDFMWLKTSDRRTDAVLVRTDQNRVYKTTVTEDGEIDPNWKEIKLPALPEIPGVL